MDILHCFSWEIGFTLSIEIPYFDNSSDVIQALAHHVFVIMSGVDIQLRNSITKMELFYNLFTPCTHLHYKANILKVSKRFVYGYYAKHTYLKKKIEIKTDYP